MKKIKDSDYMDSSYGINKHWDEGDINLEELKKIGFTIVEGLFSDLEMNQLNEEAEKLLMEQEQTVNTPESEKNMLRSPVSHSKIFRDIVIRISELELISRCLGTNIFQLQLQNGIKVEPQLNHFQSSWHRDLPYQHWVSSSPLAISVLLAVTPFKFETGATLMIPHSHKWDEFPSEEYLKKHQICIEAQPGSVIIFDSMVYHKAGRNISKNTRWAINHVFTTPILKQQISLSPSINENNLNDREKILFGHKYKTPNTIEEFHINRQN